VAGIAATKVRRGDIRHAIVVRTAKKLQRKDGHVVRFDDNACVLINKSGEPIGTRVLSTFTPRRNDRIRRGERLEVVLIMGQVLLDKS